MTNQTVLPWEYVGSTTDQWDTEHLSRLPVTGGWLYKLIPMRGSPSITFVPRPMDITHYQVGSVSRTEFRPHTDENVLDPNVPM